MTHNVSKDFIFTEDESGKMKFVGNFDEYYQSEKDPWDQSAQGESAEYYIQSRDRVAAWLNKTNANNILEIGCGLGYASEHFANIHSAKYVGWDISESAILKAQELFPNFNFAMRDITTPNLKIEDKYDVVILNQLLWYILPQLDDVLKNCLNLLENNGKLIISNAFAREQRFGNEYIDGFAGAYQYFGSVRGYAKLTHAEFNDEGFRNQDGLFIIENNACSGTD
ncbi:class I SAM-dependent methyltransferase [Paraglaciecola aquimarina]|uniref:Class I SAM-dependent methyltransferase n=1 Tax=Paraglaciecola algarum TaxID=3050085 RepID=A0ABS9D593_9ALTE|nr:class I SAM-dependent methyltransferase [Paraglaciecola sp. G1-23]MCF2948108.1 class I SAM-dependent methyltransferase [Paraglaciecola sp. G1-23]